MGLEDEVRAWCAKVQSIVNNKQQDELLALYDDEKGMFFMHDLPPFKKKDLAPLVKQYLESSFSFDVPKIIDAFEIGAGVVQVRATVHIKENDTEYDAWLVQILKRGGVTGFTIITDSMVKYSS